MADDYTSDLASFHTRPFLTQPPRMWITSWSHNIRQMGNQYTMEPLLSTVFRLHFNLTKQMLQIYLYFLKLCLKTLQKALKL